MRSNETSTILRKVIILLKRYPENTFLLAKFNFRIEAIIEDDGIY